MLRFKFYRSLLLFSVVTVIILVLIIGLLFSGLFNTYCQELMQIYAENMLAQRVYNAELLSEEMESLAKAIYSEQDVSRFFQSSEDDKILKYNAGRTLSKYKSLYSFVQNINLFNLDASFSVNTLNYGDDSAFFTEYASFGKITWQPRFIPALNSKYKDFSVLSMLYPISFIRQETVSSGIVLDIDQRHLQSLLQFTDVLPGALTVILNEEGLVVSSSSEQIFLTSYAEKDYVSRILHSSDSHGSFAWQDEDSQRLIIWEQIPNLDWTVVCSLPVSNLLARFSGILKNIILGLLIILVLAIIAVVLASHSVYQPIRQLVSVAQVPDPEGRQDVWNEIDAVAKKINLMEEDREQMLHNMHLTMVQHLLLGFPTNIEGHDTVLRQSNIYCVATLRLTKLSGEQDLNDQLTVAAGHVVTDMLREICPCESAAWSNSAVVILCLTDQLIQDSVILALDSACKWCSDQLLHPAFASLSSPVKGSNKIHDAYLEAQLVSQQSFYDPNERVFTSSILSRWKSDTSISSEWWGQRFASLLLNDDLDTLSDERKELNKLLFSKPPYQVRQYSAEIITCLYARLEHSGLPGERFRRDILIPALQAAETWAEVQRIMDAVIDECHLLTSSYGQGLKNRKLIHDVCAWIQANYSNPSMSLQSAADHVGLSASYLGRTFKAIEGLSFTEYVTAVRLEEAARQLTKTDKPISTVAFDVGLENQSYFSSLFKKEYGMTPSTYRQTMS